MFPTCLIHFDEVCDAVITPELDIDIQVELCLIFLLLLQQPHHHQWLKPK